MTMASYPANFNSGIHQPPASASPKALVNGDFAATEKRLKPVAGVPEMTDPANTRMFSGPKGSVFGSARSEDNVRLAFPLQGNGSINFHGVLLHE
jgi:hypothetical protein